MKKLLFLILLIPILCQAQTPVTITQPYNFLKWVQIRDSLSLYGLMKINSLSAVTGTQQVVVWDSIAHSFKKIRSTQIASGSSGTVTNVSSANSDIGVSNPTTTPILTLIGMNGVTKTYYDPTSSIQTQFNSKAPLASPTFNGTVAVSTTPTVVTGTQYVTVRDSVTGAFKQIKTTSIGTISQQIKIINGTSGFTSGTTYVNTGLNGVNYTLTKTTLVADRTLDAGGVDYTVTGTGGFVLTTALLAGEKINLTTTSLIGAVSTTDIIQEIPTGTVNGTNKVFTFANTPTSNTVKFFLNGMRLKSGYDFTMSGAVVTLAFYAPTTFDIFFADYKY